MIINVDFTKPIEWSDGTPATLVETRPGGATVRSEAVPLELAGSAFARLITGTPGIAVAEDGIIIAAPDGTPYIRNVAEEVKPAVPEQPETLLAAVTDPTKSGTYGPFKVANGQIKSGTNVIFQFFNGTTGLVPLSSRRSLPTAEQNETFDNFLADFRATGAAVAYISIINDFFNPKKRFDEFLKDGSVPVGVVLDDLEIQLPELLKRVQGKFKTALTPPEPVYVRSAKAAAKPLVVSGKNVKYVKYDGYSITLAKAKTMWTRLQKLWLTADPNSSNMITSLPEVMFTGYYKRPSVYNDRIEIGCKTIYRQDIEALAVAQGWLKA